jgi:AraC-like DNA-binding protein
MSIVVHQPTPPLDRYIICLWYADLRAPYRWEKILPSGALELIINFGAPFRLYDQHDSTRFALQTESWLVGLHTTYLINEPLAETHMIGVRFRPGGAAAFFPFPAFELHNQVVPADALWGRFAAEAREQLYAAPTLASRFALLERLLLVRLCEVPHGMDLVRFAVGAITHRRGAQPIKALSDQIGISQKHLDAHFRRMVGVSPKTLARIYRFQHVLHSIDPTRPVDWAAVAYDALYYDQSHFNRDFAAFSGLSPTEYLRLRRQTFGDTLARGEDIHFVPIG